MQYFVRTVELLLLLFRLGHILGYEVDQITTKSNVVAESFFRFYFYISVQVAFFLFVTLHVPVCMLFNVLALVPSSLQRCAVIWGVFWALADRKSVV